MIFFIGIDRPGYASRFPHCFISTNTLMKRKRDFKANDWILDSGAFSEINRYGDFRFSPLEYADFINRWNRCGNMLAAVTQDYICEPFAVELTESSVEHHQIWTIERYDKIQANTDAYVMPVIQGYTIEEYLRCLKWYGDRLKPGMWVGVGSVCKRNKNMSEIEDILFAIHQERPDLKLHGFGVKLTALKSGLVRRLLYSADSFAWSRAGRWEGVPDTHCPNLAQAYLEKVNGQWIQGSLLERLLGPQTGPASLDAKVNDLTSFVYHVTGRINNAKRILRHGNCILTPYNGGEKG